MTSHHHACVVEAQAEEGIAVVHAWIEKELGLQCKNNPDITLAQYGLLTVADARKVVEMAAGAPFAGEYKVVIISANRAYHEAQNALLKLFEEPPPKTYLFLIVPSIGGLLPTLLSRVQILKEGAESRSSEQGGMIYHSSASATEFVHATKEKRSAMIKKLTTGKDEEERRLNREEAIAIVNGVEALAYTEFTKKHGGEAAVRAALLSDIAALRGHLYDRSAPVKMILEHLSLVIPKELEQ